MRTELSSRLNFGAGTHTKKALKIHSDLSNHGSQNISTIIFFLLSLFPPRGTVIVPLPGAIEVQSFFHHRAPFVLVTRYLYLVIFSRKHLIITSITLLIGLPAAPSPHVLSSLSRSPSLFPSFPCSCLIQRCFSPLAASTHIFVSREASVNVFFLSP